MEMAPNKLLSHSDISEWRTRTCFEILSNDNGIMVVRMEDNHLNNGFSAQVIVGLEFRVFPVHYYNNNRRCWCAMHLRRKTEWVIEWERKVIGIRRLPTAKWMFSWSTAQDSEELSLCLLQPTLHACPCVCVCHFAVNFVSALPHCLLFHISGFDRRHRLSLI